MCKLLLQEVLIKEIIQKKEIEFHIGKYQGIGMVFQYKGKDLTFCGFPHFQGRLLVLFEVKNVSSHSETSNNQIVANVVEDDVAFAPENLGVPPQEIRARVDAALKQVGMYDFRLHAPHLLSGGQKQRVAIAGVIAMQPKCIVLDEPTAMLDPAGRREVIDTATKLCREQGITVVLITHHMEECVGADRVIVLSNGAVVADGAPKQVFSQVDLLKREGLTAPVTVRLLHALRAHGMDVPLDALTVSDCADAVAAALKP